MPSDILQVYKKSGSSYTEAGVEYTLSQTRNPACFNLSCFLRVLYTVVAAL